MSKSTSLAVAFACALTLSACGGGHHGSVRAQVAAVKLKADTGPRPLKVREIDDQIYAKKFQLRGQGYYGLDRQTLPGWINDWKGYDRPTRQRIRALLVELKGLAAAMKTAALGAKSEEHVVAADTLTRNADRSIRRMSRLDREEAGMNAFRQAFRR